MNEKGKDSNDLTDQSNNLERSNHKLTQRKKILLALLFILGLPLSYPTIFPLGLVCSGILLFQKNKKVVLAAAFMIFVQIMLLIFFGIFYSLTPFPVNF
ncbi:MAG: hypothetical protein EU549_00890 [Promethearchaeota archaeon]|nr:MAG: hypothetical protein EU549_00890 [Candidatus Lokiarchaeota archaeon]